MKLHTVDKKIEEREERDDQRKNTSRPLSITGGMTAPRCASKNHVRGARSRRFPDRGSRRRRCAEKGNGWSSAAIMFRYTRTVSLTLAKTPHLPIKRRKVIHIGQSGSRLPCNEEGHIGRDQHGASFFLEHHARLLVTWRNVDAFRELFFLAP
ncbi:uncharacterized protein LOC143216914 [Lasioglossum baleicum]|uniref:uncharacterized protein LOC143216914 n=1 Tax=Lasioglossum baleicum TaxID=434251 RepID=UPI003FCE176E